MTTFFPLLEHPHKFYIHYIEEMRLCFLKIYCYVSSSKFVKIACQTYFSKKDRQTSCYIYLIPIFATTFTTQIIPIFNIGKTACFIASRSMSGNTCLWVSSSSPNMKCLKLRVLNYSGNAP